MNFNIMIVGEVFVVATITVVLYFFFKKKIQKMADKKSAWFYQRVDWISHKKNIVDNDSVNDLMTNQELKRLITRIEELSDKTKSSINTREKIVASWRCAFFDIEYINKLAAEQAKDIALLAYHQEQIQKARKILRTSRVISIPGKTIVFA